MELQLGQVYQFKVIDIDENWDSFKGKAGVKYCHGFCLEHNGEEYNCQICTDSTKQNFCSIGDKVNAKVSKLNRGQYTLENIQVVDGPKRSTPAASAPLPNTPTPVVSSGNLLLRGSAAEIALQQAVQFTCKASHMPGVEFPDIEDVLKNADQIYNWLLKKNNEI